MNKILILLTLSLFCINANADSIYDAKKISAATIDQWKKEVKESFDKAEKEVYKNVNPDNTPVGPNEDPKKCACKGTGRIVHGDGHTTPCPYHSKQNEIQAEAKDCKSGNCPIIKEKKTTCQCDTKCGCVDCKCLKMEIK